MRMFPYYLIFMPYVALMFIALIYGAIAGLIMIPYMKVLGIKNSWSIYRRSLIRIIDRMIDF